jgi:hypothetical protein
MSLYDQAKAIVNMAKRRMAITGAYHSVYNSPDGQLVIHDILREAGVLSAAHVAGDPGSSQVNEGKRLIGLMILQRLRFSEGALVKLAQLQANEEIEEG